MQGLPKMDMLGESDPFVKVLLLIKIIHYSFFLLLLKMTEGVHFTARPKQHQPCCQEKEGSQVLTKK